MKNTFYLNKSIEKNKRKYLTFILVLLSLFLFPLSGFSQHENHNCETDNAMKELLKKNPEMKKSMEQIEAHTKKNKQQNETTRTYSESETGPSIITIPIVFHIIYNTDDENIPESRIHLMLESLNKDFRRLNSDTSYTREIFKPYGADTKIKFCLASTDPDGYATNGITRTFSYKTSFMTYPTTNEMKFDSLGGKSGWPPGDYLNVWICNINGGYAYYPGLTGSDKALDGVVISNTGTFNLWHRLLTHETGHYLNLKHIWGDGDCSVDDLVDDTPLAGISNSGTPTDNPNSCLESSNDMPDMHENYMDYTAYNATNIFSFGQSDRMNALFKEGGYRNSLLYSNGCDTGETHPCPPPENIKYIRASNSIIINWDEVIGISSYNLRINDGSSTWTVNNVANTTYTISNISTCKYIFEVSSNCSNSTAYYAKKQIMLAPDSMHISGTSRNTTFSWRAIPGVSNYVLNYRKSATSSWTSVGNISGNSKTVKNLSNNEKYQWRVSASCFGDNNWSRIINFTAGENVLCPATTSFKVNNYGESINQLLWSPTSNAETYTIRVRPNNSADWTVNYSNSSYILVSNFASCSGFEFQVESNCPTTTSGYSSSHNFTSSGCCTKPGSISVNDISNTSASIAWSPFWPSTNAVKYFIRFRKKNTSTWTIDSTTITTFNYSNLSACTDYEFEIESVCENSLSGYTSTTSFKTTGCTSACDAPTGLFVSNINKRNARLNWGVVSGATSYEVSYWIKGSSSVTTLTTTSTQVSLSGLNINSTYEWRVRAYCTSVWSSYSTTHSFIAGNTSSGGSFPMQDEQNLSNSENEYKIDEKIQMLISPNPSTGIISVLYESVFSEATGIQIVDLQGRVLMQIPVENGLNFNQQIDLSHLTNGMYMIYILQNNTLLKSAKIIKTE
ncbi:MAG: fibronectin type III domain-containing protein [Bacteroidota bacterium]|nr:fibronectin type III domain-containing protein [Bacteroidota bacterium]